MVAAEDIVIEIVKRFKQQGFSQVADSNSFGFIQQGDNHVMVSREKGKDTRIPYKKLIEAVEAVRKDTSAYTDGPSRLRQHGLTHITSPLWSLLHLMTLEELRS